MFVKTTTWLIKKKNALFKECLYTVLNSNDLWDLADEQWFCEGQASPTLKIRERAMLVGSRINNTVGGPKMGHGRNLQRLRTIYNLKGWPLWVFSA